MPCYFINIELIYKLTNHHLSFQWLKKVDKSQGIPNTNTTFEYMEQWYIVLPDADRVWSRADGTYLTKLIIHSVTARDAGVYICLAANSIGYSAKPSYLSVLTGW